MRQQHLSKKFCATRRFFSLRCAWFRIVFRASQSSEKTRAIVRLMIKEPHHHPSRLEDEDCCGPGGSQAMSCTISPPVLAYASLGHSLGCPGDQLLNFACARISLHPRTTSPPEIFPIQSSPGRANPTTPMMTLSARFKLHMCRLNSPMRKF